MLQIKEHKPGTNVLDIDPSAMSDQVNAAIEIFGSGNTIRFRLPSICFGLYVMANDNSLIEIEEGCIFHNQFIRAIAPGSVVKIGARSAFNGTSVIHAHETGQIRIGRDCLLADNVSISTSHVHKIIDKLTGERLNPPGDIQIDDHVWISQDASIWGGANIGRDCIVGKATMVSKTFQDSCLIAGSPARVVRENVTWEA